MKYTVTLFNNSKIEGVGADSKYWIFYILSYTSSKIKKHLEVNKKYVVSTKPDARRRQIPTILTINNARAHGWYHLRKDGKSLGTVCKGAIDSLFGKEKTLYIYTTSKTQQ